MRNAVILHMLIFGVSLNISALAQTTSSAIVSSTIIQPISILNVRDLNFGNVSSGTTSGTVVLEPTEASSRIATGGVSLPSGSSTVHSAKFIISGADGCSYSILLPSAPITLNNGTSFMSIDNFTSTPSGPGTFTSGSQSICVGAMLNVNASQEAGLYVSTVDFEITVAYD